MSVVSATLTGSDQWTPALAVHGSDERLGPGVFDMAVDGTFDANVKLQVSYDGGATWQDTGDIVTSPSLDRGEVATSCHLRAGIKTAGDYTSGSVTVRISQ